MGLLCWMWDLFCNIALNHPMKPTDALLLILLTYPNMIPELNLPPWWKVVFFNQKDFFSLHISFRTNHFGPSLSRSESCGKRCFFFFFCLKGLIMNLIHLTSADLPMIKLCRGRHFVVHIHQHAASPERYAQRATGQGPTKSSEERRERETNLRWTLTTITNCRWGAKNIFARAGEVTFSCACMLCTDVAQLRRRCPVRLLPTSDILCRKLCLQRGETEQRNLSFGRLKIATLQKKNPTDFSFLLYSAGWKSQFDFQVSLVLSLIKTTRD